MATKPSAAKTKTPAKKPAAKPAAKAPAKKPAAKPAAAKKSAKPTTKAAPTDMKSIKETFTKSALLAHLAAAAQVELKAVRNVMTALEATVLGALNKKGVGEFTLPGLLKIIATKVPAKAKRFGKNPFTGEEQWFAAKPASVKVKVRPLAKLRSAPL